MLTRLRNVLFLFLYILVPKDFVKTFTSPLKDSPSLQKFLIENVMEASKLQKDIEISS